MIQRDCCRRNIKNEVFDSCHERICNMKKGIKICITCSSGGHLTEALKATQNLKGDKFFVTFWDPRVETSLQGYRYYLITHPKRNPLLLMKNCYNAIRVLLKERPDLIISTGADVTVCVCILGKLLGRRLIYIESGGNVYTPSLTGRILYPFADLFIVQWRPLKVKLKRAVHGGPLF